MSAIDNLNAKIEDLRNEISKLTALAEMAGREWWLDVDPGFTNLKEMANLQADAVLVAAQAVKDAVPA